MRAIIAVPVFLVLMSSVSAHAAGIRFELGAGNCEYGLSEKGSWWNDAYETNIDRNGTCYQIGLSQAPWKWGKYDLGWRAAYVRFPKLTTNSVMAARDDEQFQHPNGSECDPATFKGCTIRTTGGGRAQGVSLGGLIERRYGPTTLGAEAGMFVYHNEFDIRITPGNGEKFAPYVWDLAEGWLATPYLGATLNYGYLFVSGRAYQGIKAHGECGGCSGITQGTAWQWNVGVSVPLK